ncbi:MAG: flagellar protein FliT [Burkholderiales bacterium]
MPAESKAPTAAPVETLAQAVDLSRQMLEAAHAADWDALARLEAQRAPLLERALEGGAGVLPRAQVERHGAQLAACLRLNDEIATLTGAHVARLAELIAEATGRPADRGAPPGDG